MAPAEAENGPGNVEGGLASEFPLYWPLFGSHGLSAQPPDTRADIEAALQVLDDHADAVIQKTAGQVFITVAGGTLYVADQGAHNWGFVSDDLMVAGYESGPIAHLLPEAERTIDKLRRPVYSISPDHGLDLQFVAKKAARPWRLLRYTSGDWEWVIDRLFKGGRYESNPGRHVARWAGPSIPKPQMQKIIDRDDEGLRLDQKGSSPST